MSSEFGENLRELRYRKGYTQLEVAKLLNVDRTTYTKYETGVSQPDLDRLKQLCELFEVDYNTILNY